MSWNIGDAVVGQLDGGVLRDSGIVFADLAPPREVEEGRGDLDLDRFFVLFDSSASVETTRWMIIRGLEAAVPSFPAKVLGPIQVPSR